MCCCAAKSTITVRKTNMKMYLLLNMPVSHCNVSFFWGGTCTNWEGPNFDTPLQYTDIHDIPFFGMISRILGLCSSPHQTLKEWVLVCQHWPWHSQNDVLSLEHWEIYHLWLVNIPPENYGLITGLLTIDFPLSNFCPLISARGRLGGVVWLATNLSAKIQIEKLRKISELLCGFFQGETCKHRSMGES